MRSLLSKYILFMIIQNLKEEDDDEKKKRKLDC